MKTNLKAPLPPSIELEVHTDSITDSSLPKIIMKLTKSILEIGIICMFISVAFMLVTTSTPQAL